MSYIVVLIIFVAIAYCLKGKPKQSEESHAYGNRPAVENPDKTPISKKTEILKQAMNENKSVKIAYYGGSQAGKVREIFIFRDSIYDDDDDENNKNNFEYTIEAFCIATRQIKNFYISRMSIVSEETPIDYIPDKDDTAPVNIDSIIVEAIIKKEKLVIKYQGTEYNILPKSYDGDNLYIFESENIFYVKYIETISKNGTEIYKNKKLSIIQDAICQKKTLKIKYRYGIQRGTVREIKVNSFDFDSECLFVFDVTSKIERKLLFNSLELAPSNAQITYNPNIKDVGQIAFTEIEDIYKAHKTFLESLGLEIVRAGDSISLHKINKAGKMQKIPEITIGYSEEYDGEKINCNWCVFGKGHDRTYYTAKEMCNAVLDFLEYCKKIGSGSK